MNVGGTIYQVSFAVVEVFVMLLLASVDAISHWSKDSMRGRPAKRVTISTTTASGARRRVLLARAGWCALAEESAEPGYAHARTRWREVRHASTCACRRRVRCAPATAFVVLEILANVLLILTASRHAISVFPHSVARLAASCVHLQMMAMRATHAAALGIA